MGRAQGPKLLWVSTPAPKTKNETLVLKLDWDWWNPAHWLDWLFMNKTGRYTVHMNRIRGLSISGAGNIRQAG